MIFQAIGPIASILLGLVLSAFRDFTSASNFAFFFIVLTILIAEYGGARAAVTTALASALSLDFFLTQPYLRLTIADKHDIIAFCWLAACGLVVANFSWARAKRAAELKSVRHQMNLLHSAIVTLEDTENTESRLWKLLDAIRAACPLDAAAIRDNKDRVLAAFQTGEKTSRVPGPVISPQSLIPAGSASQPALESVVLPEQGARVPLVLRNRQVGWLDLWGNGQPANADSRQTLADVTIVLSLILAGPENGPVPVRGQFQGPD
jgi:K+-sensing histidine kinase KdpD